MKVTIYNEQGLLEIEACVEVTHDDPEFGGGLIAEVISVRVEGVKIPPYNLSGHLLEELQQQALEEA